jgi:hypothetical protein
MGHSNAYGRWNLKGEANEVSSWSSKRWNLKGGKGGANEVGSWSFKTCSNPKEQMRWSPEGITLPGDKETNQQWKRVLVSGKWASLGGPLRSGAVSFSSYQRMMKWNLPVLIFELPLQFIIFGFEFFYIRTSVLNLAPFSFSLLDFIFLFAVVELIFEAFDQTVRLPGEFL